MERLELFLLERSLAAFDKLEAKLRRRAEKLNKIITRKRQALSDARAALAAYEAQVEADTSRLSGYAARAERVAGKVGSLIA